MLTRPCARLGNSLHGQLSRSMAGHWIRILAARGLGQGGLERRMRGPEAVATLGRPALDGRVLCKPKGNLQGAFLGVSGSTRLKRCWLSSCKPGRCRRSCRSGAGLPLGRGLDGHHFSHAHGSIGKLFPAGWVGDVVTLSANPAGLNRCLSHGSWPCQSVQAKHRVELDSQRPCRYCHEGQ